MLLKPNSCIGCPLYGTGHGFVPDQIVEDSDTMIIMQNPGSDEEKSGIPAVGLTGQVMNGSFIPLAGLYREVTIDDSARLVSNNSTVSVGNILKCRMADETGKATNDLPVGETLEIATAHCTNAHLRIPEHVKYIVAQGALAFEYFSGGQLHENTGKPSTLTDWRGHCIPDTHNFEGRRVFITGHIADHFRDPKQGWISRQDWKRIRLFREGKYPLNVPDRITLNSFQERYVASEWFERARHSGKDIICDTEFDLFSDKDLTVVGLGYRDSTGTITGLQLDLRTTATEFKEWVRDELKQLVQTNRFVFHNAIADTLVLEQNCQIQYGEYKRIDDTMLLHSVLWGELPHTLDFCGSIYSPYPRLKHLSGEDLLYYNWGDVITTIVVWEALQDEVSYDNGAKEVYENQLLKLIPILVGAKKRGIRVNRERVLEAQPILKQGMEQATQLARVGIGRPINLGSDDQLKYYLYKVKAYPIQKNKDTKRPTTDDDAIGLLREHVGPPFDPKVDLTYDMAVDRVLAGADPILESRVLYVATEHILNNYIIPLHKEAKRGGHTKAKNNRLLNQHGVWIRENILERIYPDIATHIQKSGRHSTSNPPLAQLPAEYRDIICPDPGHIWIKWDWSSIEPRLLEALCGSIILKRSFDEGIDLHTWTVCEIFGYPLPADLVNPHKCKCSMECIHEGWRRKVAWKGKEDPRRVFAKAGRYEVWYGGTGSNAAASAARFGLDKRILKSAVQRLASSDPDYFKWRGELTDEVKRTRLIRSWAGRPRRFLGQGAGVIREALNHPMQAGVSDIYNLTIVELSERIHEIQYVFGMHDSQWWACPTSEFTRELFNRIKNIVEQARNIGGVIREFPADFEIIDEWSNYYGKSHDYSIEDWFNGARYTSMCTCAGCKGRTYRGI